jgi:ribosomal protein L7Ae-like RNA K-turn-binding protein
MKVVITGSRSITDRAAVEKALDRVKFDTLISGGAKGVDQMAEDYAKDHGIEVVRVKPNWKLGRHAGYTANAEMARMGDLLVAVHDGVSKGTAHMVKEMQKLNKPVLLTVVS